MNKTTGTVLIVVIFLAAGVLYYVRSASLNDLSSQREYNAKLHCLSCGEIYGADLDVKDRAPFDCPKCKKKTAWFVWNCGNCKKEFTPKPEGDPPDQPMIPKCSHCGGAFTYRVN